MREIKFRGQDIMDGKWVYGFAVIDTIDAYIIPHSNIFRKEPEIPQPMNWIEVDEETVGEYTGLRDKNGVEIYEGDIIQVDSFYETIPHYPTDNQTADLIGSVKIINGCFEADSVPLYMFFETHNPELEVIGNIFEDKNLIEL